jgi:hypothetical protein
VPGLQPVLGRRDGLGPPDRSANLPRLRMAHDMRGALGPSDAAGSRLLDGGQLKAVIRRRDLLCTLSHEDQEMMRPLVIS